ncbi:MAG TPA: hypothetical protein VK957_08960 [Lunatimonas sp.]|nr:hypothetical protein [Lunatimonas sp.]
MVETTKIISIFIIMISIFGGILSFYLVSDLPKEQRKSQIKEITSQIVNLILFIWAGKIIVNFPVFISDPLAILAYPSDSSAFYVAILLTSLLLFYRSYKGQLNVLLLIQTMVPIFLLSSFLFEFIQFSWNDQTLSFGYLILLAILIILYLLLQRRLKVHALISTMLIGWALGIWILTIVQPFVTVFGYMMAPWFIVLFFAASLTLLLINKRKSGNFGRN